MNNKLFAIIAKDAETSPTLAKKMIAAFPETIGATFEMPKREPTFDATAYHAVNIPRMHGEAILGEILEQTRT